MAELSFRALADAGVLVTCPLPNCGDQLHPRALRRHLEGQKHRLAGEELLDSCKRARCLPCAFTLSGGATNAELEAVTPIADAGMLSLALPTVPVSPEQLRLYFSSFYDADGGCPVAVATLALRVHLDEPNVSIEHAAEAVRSAALLCDDLVLSACGAFVSRADTLPTGGEQPTVSGGPCCADGASWLPWANATECVLWLLFHKLALSEEQQAVVLQTLRLPCFRLAHVPLSPAFYQRVAKDIRPCVGRVVVETPTEADMTVDVLLPSELIRVAVNAPRMFSTLRFKPFAYDVHDPCADHFNSSRLARAIPRASANLDSNRDGARVPRVGDGARARRRGVAHAGGRWRLVRLGTCRAALGGDVRHPQGGACRRAAPRQRRHTRVPPCALIHVGGGLARRRRERCTCALRADRREAASCTLLGCHAPGIRTAENHGRRAHLRRRCISRAVGGDAAT